MTGLFLFHLLLVLQEIISKDPDVSPYMTVLMVENYNVSYAEKMIPVYISRQVFFAVHFDFGDTVKRLFIVFVFQQFFQFI